MYLILLSFTDYTVLFWPKLAKLYIYLVKIVYFIWAQMNYSFDQDMPPNGPIQQMPWA